MRSIFISSPYTINPYAEGNRKHLRHARNDISVTVKKSLFSKCLRNVYLLDISTHGAAICCTKPLTKKILLRIKLTFNESVNFILKGKIIHIKKKR